MSQTQPSPVYDDEFIAFYYKRIRGNRFEVVKCAVERSAEDAEQYEITNFQPHRYEDWQVYVKHVLSHDDHLEKVKSVYPRITAYCTNTGNKESPYYKLDICHHALTRCCVGIETSNIQYKSSYQKNQNLLQYEFSDIQTNQLFKFLKLGTILVTGFRGEYTISVLHNRFTRQNQQTNILGPKFTIDQFETDFKTLEKKIRDKYFSCLAYIKAINRKHLPLYRKYD